MCSAEMSGSRDSVRLRMDQTHSFTHPWLRMDQTYSFPRPLHYPAGPGLTTLLLPPGWVLHVQG